MPWWHVDQKISYLSSTNRLEMLDDGVQVPAAHVLGGRLNNVPGLPHELTQASAREFLIDLFDQGWP